MRLAQAATGQKGRSLARKTAAFAPEDVMKRLAPLAFVGLALAFSIGASSKQADPKDAKVSLTLRATPAMAFAPARITLIAQLKGGTPESEDLYCPTVEWDWGDGTISQASADCEPFQPNKSDIQRSFSTQHIYKTGGEYQVKLLLKKAEKVVVEAATSLNISRAINEVPDHIR
jgi:hypothetical protein